MPPKRTLTLSLPPQQADALAQLARDERRHPRDQAAVLVIEGLARHEAADSSATWAPPLLTERGDGDA
jgi:hypothetical protein